MTYLLIWVIVATCIIIWIGGATKNDDIENNLF
jgi:hypothetical protein